MATMSNSNTAPPPPRRRRLLIGITGSVAAVKGPELVLRLIEKTPGIDIQILLTKGGHHFWNKAKEYDATSWEAFLKLQQKQQQSILKIISPLQEWQSWHHLGDPVLHIELRDWADALLIAPLSAHCLAKFATGLCDDTLSCVMRAWNFQSTLTSTCDTTSLTTGSCSTTSKSKPLILAPAMNTEMWNHVLTREQLQKIASFYNDGLTPDNNNIDKMTVVDPVHKLLACGQLGQGALAAVEDIVDTVDQVLRKDDME